MKRLGPFHMKYSLGHIHTYFCVSIRNSDMWSTLWRNYISERIKKDMNKITIIYDVDHMWFTVTFPGNKKRNYGSLATLLSALSDHYKKSVPIAKEEKKVVGHPVAEALLLKHPLAEFPL